MQWTEPAAMLLVVRTPARHRRGRYYVIPHRYMGRPHRDVVVVIGYDAAGHTVAEDIIPRRNFAVSGSLLLNSATIRHRDGIRMISVRVFDEHGARLDREMRYFASDGAPVEAIHRRPDGTIIGDDVQPPEENAG